MNHAARGVSRFIAAAMVAGCSPPPGPSGLVETALWTVPPIPRPSGLVCRDKDVCALTPSGRVVCWGEDERPVVVQDPTGTSPLHADGLRWGGREICADASDVAMCWEGTPPASITARAQWARGIQSSHWGMCELDRDGLGCTDEMERTRFDTGRAGTLSAFSASRTTLCALDDTGRVGCFDHGLALLMDPRRPARVTLDPVDGVAHAWLLAVGDFLACAASGRSVACWGPVTQRVTRVESVAGAIALATTVNGACAILGTRDVECWTYAAGSGGQGLVSTHRRVEGMPRAVDLGCADEQCCARDEEGGAWCWQPGAPSPTGRAVGQALRAELLR